MLVWRNQLEIPWHLLRCFLRSSCSENVEIKNEKKNGPLYILVCLKSKMFLSKMEAMLKSVSVLSMFEPWEKCQKLSKTYFRVHRHVLRPTCKYGVVTSSCPFSYAP